MEQQRLSVGDNSKNSKKFYCCQWNRERFDDYENAFLEKYLCIDTDPNDKFPRITEYNHIVANQMVFMGRKLPRYAS